MITVKLIKEHVLLLTTRRRKMVYHATHHWTVSWKLSHLFCFQFSFCWIFFAATSVTVFLCINDWSFANLRRKHRCILVQMQNIKYRLCTCFTPHSCVFLHGIHRINKFEQQILSVYWINGISLMLKEKRIRMVHETIISKAQMLKTSRLKGSKIQMLQ